VVLCDSMRRAGNAKEGPQRRADPAGVCGKRRVAPWSPTSAASMGSAKRPSISGRRKYSGLGLSELRELRQLREENGKPNNLVADLPLDRHILQEIEEKRSICQEIKE
jgi:hypothetical protein